MKEFNSPAYGRLAKVNEFHTKQESKANFTVLLGDGEGMLAGSANLTDGNRLFVRQGGFEIWEVSRDVGLGIGRCRDIKKGYK